MSMAVILCGLEKNDNKRSVRVHLLIHAKRKKGVHQPDGRWLNL